MTDIDESTKTSIDWQVTSVLSSREEAISRTRAAARKLMLAAMNLLHDPEDVSNKIDGYVAELHAARADIMATRVAEKQTMDLLQILGIEVTDRMSEMKKGGMYKHTPSLFELILDLAHTTKDQDVHMMCHAALRGDTNAVGKVMLALGSRRP